MLDLAAGAEVVERALGSASPTSSAPRDALHERLVRVARDGDPVAVLAEPVLGVGLDGRGDVGRQRPRRRRPDDERLARAVEQREADEERRVGLVLVDAALRQLVLRDRRPAARAPLRRAVALVEPAALVHGLRKRQMYSMFVSENVK